MFVPSDKQVSKSMKYLRQLKEQMELQKAKVDSIHFRNHVMQMQKNANYDNEIHRFKGELAQITQKGLTNTRIEKRLETLEKLKKHNLI